MYLNFPSLNEDPFRIAPDPHYLYLSKGHARAKSYIESTGFLTDGFVVITGDAGTGKSILINHFLSNLPANVITAKIHQTNITPVQFLQIFLNELGFKPFKKKKAELLSMLNMFLLGNHSDGNRTILVVDEAQELSKAVLEEIRMLAGIETDHNRILSIVLAGQPEFKEKLQSPRMKQFAQRAPLNFSLRSLNRSETQKYIKHRLAVAGDTTGEIFKPETFDLIYQRTAGVPRLINTLCNTSLVCAFADEVTIVSADTVMTALSELEWGQGGGREDQKLLQAAQNSEDVERQIAAIKAAARKKLAELARKSEEQEKVIARLQTDIDTKVSKVKSLEGEIHNLREFAQKSDTQAQVIRELRSRIDEKIAKVVSLESEIERVRELESDGERQDGPSRRSLEKQTEVLSQTINVLKSRYEEARIDQLALGKQYEEVNADNAQLAKELRTKKELIEKYEQDVERLRREKVLRRSNPESPASVDTSFESDEVRMLVALDDASTKYPIRPGRLSLGSSRDSDVHINSGFISPHHAQIVSNATACVLEDLDSTNGTFVNSKRIRKHALRDGDSLTIGKHKFRYVKEQVTTPKFNPTSGETEAADSKREMIASYHAVSQDYKSNY